ncbi:MAG: crotonase/enoyl-CoA hydratase family protein, partial [bacterium]
MTQEAPAGRVTHERIGHTLKITIDNPTRRNSFIPEMMDQLSDALTLLDSEPELRVGVLCAEGGHFTAGLDMPKFFGPGATSRVTPEGNVDVFQLAKVCSKPIITAVQGITYTVGIEMLLAGDIAVAAEDVRFCQMEAKRGLAPLAGGHFRFLTRMGWGDAMYHLLLVDEFGAQEALRIGLVQEVVPVGKQTERALELAEIIAANAPLGIQVTKRAARKYIEVGEAAAAASIADIRATVMGSEDMQEGIRSFMERRPAV